MSIAYTELPLQGSDNDSTLCGPVAVIPDFRILLFCVIFSLCTKPAGRRPKHPESWMVGIHATAVIALRAH
jgi:hypothetical protein